MFTQIRTGVQDAARWLTGGTRSPVEPPAPLTADAVARLRLPWESRFTLAELGDYVAANPWSAVCIPGTGGYGVAGMWQARSDIGVIVEVLGSGRREDLVNALMSSLQAQGARLVVISQDEDMRALGFYKHRGWVEMEEVLVYRRPDVLSVPRADGLRYLPLDAARAGELQQLEEAAFPWLWQYGPSFFEEVSTSVNQRLLLAYDAGRLVGYIIVTLHHDLGHLDRLAVLPEFQGQGFGRQLLLRALDEMASLGARTAALSTQSGNARSQRLYEDHGFLRAGSYRIFGKWLAPDGRELP
jgi:ribosomal protein S18 acetylase RimI-like enzyme